MKNRKIRRCIIIIWCILAVAFLIAVNLYDGNDSVERIISNLVRVYMGVSFIIIGIMYKLGKNK